MSDVPYDLNGRPYDREEAGANRRLLPAVFAAMAAVALIAVMGNCASTQPVEADTQPTYKLVLDCSNAAVMHSYGMPTKSDVMEWHVNGRWGWIDRSGTHMFAELPGGSEAWDGLYGIGDSKAFKY